MTGYLGFFGQTNNWTHDHSMSFGTPNLLKYLQLERYTRTKFDNKMPYYISQILNEVNFELDEAIMGYANTFDIGEAFFKKSDNKIFSLKNQITIDTDGSSELTSKNVRGSIGTKKYDFQVIPHEIAHLFSSIPFYGLFKENSLLIHIDGAASLCNASAWLYKNNELKLLEATSEFHHALLNYSYNDLSFEILGISKSHHLSMPGKLMGYASYGKSDPAMYNWLLKHDFFRDYSQHSRDLIIEYMKKKGFDVPVNNFLQKHQFSYDFAACVQYHFENKIMQFITKHKQGTGAKYLYYSGGAALNIKLNGSLVNSQMFDEVYIPPPSGDSGLSLGVVSYLQWKHKEDLISQQDQPFLNNLFLENYTYDPNFDVNEVAKMLQDGKIIGVCTGNAEAGPRALGHRSILASPVDEAMFQKVSRQIKKREWYRPIAPIVQEKMLPDLFRDYTPSKIMEYMLYEFQVKKEVRDKIPAVVHVDGTSRAQIVRSKNKQLKLINEILNIVFESYSIPCLINTSFNSAGEPIVHTHQDALKSAKSMKLDAVILNNDLVIL